MQKCPVPTQPGLKPEWEHSNCKQSFGPESMIHLSPIGLWQSCARDGQYLPIIPSEDMGELLVEEYGQLTNNNGLAFLENDESPAQRLWQCLKKKKNKTLSLLYPFLSILIFTHRIYLQFSKSPCYPVLYTLAVNESASPWSSQKCRVSGSGPDPLNRDLHFHKIPRWFQCRWLENHSLIDFPFHSFQFLYYTDNLASSPTWK